jgi:hypothetical protein
MEGASSSSNTGKCSQSIWPDLKQEQLAALAAAADTLTSSAVELMPEYGCALLALGPTDGSEDGAVPAAPSFSLGQLSLHLVGLDNWEFRLHRWAPSVAAVLATWLCACC